MSDCFNAITLAVWVYVLIPFWMVWGYYWIKNKRVKRRERQRIDELIAKENAELDRMNATYNLDSK
ncbi:hypothetical protein QP868_08320 [Brevibacterium sp. UMB1308A]|uniref:hypothetical protein n=1 Tax=Brevibacterium sp. UMB1308A TaxID=3050608 RepID=UPI002551B4D6|nr:hypothetical protein [Brevibacterium sp. UMB1308A]MDK8345235.1 hypothetical protein [Brevibacterium sp. UMB1308B]MDK8713903.1 hypothetical protein [Brevibacterium sp. UMB1308A]